MSETLKILIGKLVRKGLFALFALPVLVAIFGKLVASGTITADQLNSWIESTAVIGAALVGMLIDWLWPYIVSFVKKSLNK